MPRTNEPTMFHESNRLAKRMSRYSRFKEVAGAGHAETAGRPWLAHIDSLALRAGGGEISPSRLSLTWFDVVVDIPLNSVDNAQVSNLFRRPELASVSYGRRLMTRRILYVLRGALGACHPHRLNKLLKLP
jgi:hypothetical protein